MSSLPSNPSAVSRGKRKAVEPETADSTSPPREDSGEEDELDPSPLTQPPTKRRRISPGSPPVKEGVPIIKHSEFVKTSKTGSGRLAGVVLGPRAAPPASSSSSSTDLPLSARLRSRSRQPPPLVSKKPAAKPKQTRARSKKTPEPNARVPEEKAKVPRKSKAKGKGSRSVPIGPPRPIPVTIAAIDRELVRVLEITKQIQPPVRVCYGCAIDPWEHGCSPTASGTCYACVVRHQPCSLKHDVDLEYRAKLLSHAYHYARSSPASKSFCFLLLVWF